MKKIISLMLVITLTLPLLIGCGAPNREDATTSQDIEDSAKEGEGGNGEKIKLSLWSFTDELSHAIKEFQKRHPNVEIQLTVIPNEDYPTKIRPVLQSGKGAPDIFTGELQQVKEWVEASYWEDLAKEPYNAGDYLKDMVQYVADIGIDSKGRIKALSWQTTPGAYIYRRSVAKEYLGTDDPEEIGKMMSNMDDFIDLGRTLRDKSNGKIKLVSGVDDCVWIPHSLKENAWVEDGKFVIDEKIVEHFKNMKLFREENLDAKTNQWGPPWFELMNNGEVFGFLLPTWGLHYVLKRNAPDTSGDWGLTSPPAPYFWGGTWLGIYSRSKHKDVAWEFIKMVTSDEEYLQKLINDTGEFVSNKKIIDKVKDDFSDDFLDGQNHYAFFAEEIEKIDASKVTKYDQQINIMMQSIIEEYVDGKIDLNKALNRLKQNVKAAYPELVVD